MGELQQTCPTSLIAIVNICIIALLSCDLIVLIDTFVARIRIPLVIFLRNLVKDCGIIFSYSRAWGIVPPNRIDGPLRFGGYFSKFFADSEQMAMTSTAVIRFSIRFWPPTTHERK